MLCIMKLLLVSGMPPVLIRFIAIYITSSNISVENYSHFCPVLFSRTYVNLNLFRICYNFQHTNEFALQIHERHNLIKSALSVSIKLSAHSTQTQFVS